MEKIRKPCPWAKECGGCRYQGIEYSKQLRKKQAGIERLLSGFGNVSRIIGMDDPYHYRNKVHRAFTKDGSGNIISGPYEEGSHWIIDVKHCLIEDEDCQKAAEAVKGLIKEMRVPVYNEKTGHGVIRRCLIRKGLATGEIMAVIVTGGKFAGAREFAKALKERCPRINTIILNLNEKRSSMILGDKEEVLYGLGFIRDRLCGLDFQLTSKSFYQVNPAQTEVIYKKAMEFARLEGGEKVIDAYCGIGTIGLTAAKCLDPSGQVIGIELNRESISCARKNAELNNITNARFITGDAGTIMKEMAAGGERADVIFMDPPRSGASISFMKAAIRMKPSRIVYISCGPESLARNLKFFRENGYEAEKIQPIDNFPFTQHVETVCLLSNRKRKPDSYVKVSLDMEDYYRIKDGKEPKSEEEK